MAGACCTPGLWCAVPFSNCTPTTHTRPPDSPPRLVWTPSTSVSLPASCCTTCYASPVPWVSTPTPSPWLPSARAAPGIGIVEGRRGGPVGLAPLSTPPTLQMAACPPSAATAFRGRRACGAPGTPGTWHRPGSSGTQSPQAHGARTQVWSGPHTRARQGRARHHRPHHDTPDHGATARIAHDRCTKAVSALTPLKRPVAPKTQHILHLNPPPCVYIV